MRGSAPPRVKIKTALFVASKHRRRYIVTVVATRIAVVDIASRGQNGLPERSAAFWWRRVAVASVRFDEACVTIRDVNVLRTGQHSGQKLALR